MINVNVQDVVTEVKRLRTDSTQAVTLECLRQMLRIHFVVQECNVWLADHAVMCALLAGAIELRPARLVTGENTNTYMVFVRE